MHRLSVTTFVRSKSNGTFEILVLYIDLAYKKAIKPNVIKLEQTGPVIDTRWPTTLGVQLYFQIVKDKYWREINLRHYIHNIISL